MDAHAAATADHATRPLTELVVADVGGTHVRFALATIASGRIAALTSPVVSRVVEHTGLAAAWTDFARRVGQTLPRAAAIAVACPVGDVLCLTNNPWIIRRADLAGDLGLDRLTVCNDFAAVGHAVARLEASAFAPLCGPDRPLDRAGGVAIVGPGTGLGVAQLVGDGDRYTVVATEGGHAGFAPVDAIDDAILLALRRRFGRVSVERIVSGPGLLDLARALAEIDGVAAQIEDAPAFWAAAKAGTDARAAAALDRWCASLGAVTGDIAMTQGAFGGVVIAGGLGLRLAAHLPRSGFAAAFVAKGRFGPLMASIPVRVLLHPEPGLFGAAAAFVHEHGAD